MLLFMVLKNFGLGFRFKTLRMPSRGLGSRKKEEEGGHKNKKTRRKTLIDATITNTEKSFKGTNE